MTNKTIIAKVKKARKLIDKRTRQKAELEGRRKQLMERLRTDFGMSSVREAENRVKELEAELKDKGQQVSDLVEELDEMIGEIGE